MRIAANNGPSTAVVTVYKRDDGGVSASQTVQTTESWVYFDFTDMPMPRGVYLIRVESTTNNPVRWKYANGSCINDSHLMYDGNMHLDEDMGFAIYAYDSSQSNPDQSVPSGSSDQLQGESLAGNTGTTGSSKSSGTSGSSGNSSNYPSKEDILNMTFGGDRGTDGAGIWGGFFSGLWGSAFWIIFLIVGFLFFVGIVILVIWLIVRSRRKKYESERSKK